MRQPVRAVRPCGPPRAAASPLRTGQAAIWGALADPAGGQTINAHSRPEDLIRLPRARGTLALTARARDGATVIGDLSQSGASKLLFPRTGGDLTAVVLNTAGGVTGGDSFTLTAAAGPGTHLTLTTQTAERVYRALPGTPGHVSTRLTVADGASLHWLPQETILFDRSALDRRLTVDLAPGARLLLCESLIFGRAAMDEVVREARLTDRVIVRRDGLPLVADAVRMDGDAAALLARPAVAGGAAALASVTLVAPGAAAHLSAIRDLIGPLGGASAPEDDLLRLRLLAPDGFDLRRALVPVLTRLAGRPLPKVWSL